jgi:anti-sigma factor RsiW
VSLRPDPHLGELAAALVDGELDHDARDRVLAHLAHCAPCRAEVDDQRRAKAVLSALDDVPVPPALEGALLSLPGHAAGTGGELGRRGDARRPDTRRPAGRRGRGRATRVPSAHRPRRVRYLVGGASFVLAGLGAAVIAGGQATGPSVTPQVDRFVVEHVATTGELPFNDPAVGAVTVSYSSVTGP